MSKTFRAWEVDQVQLFPPSVRDLVPEGHLAHFVRDTVRNDLDLSAILETYEEERGYPPYHPVMMTALLLYGYCRGVYSSRRVARACREWVDFMAVTAGQTPDFRTISDFRKRHLKALGALFGQVLKLCQRAGLVKLGHVALDGTKVKANASKHKAMSYRRMQEEVARWFAEAERIDAEEDALYGTDQSGDEIPEWAKDKEKRRERIRAILAEMKAEAEGERENDDDERPPRSGGRRTPKPSTQRNFTDPDSRIMKSGGGFVQAYNCQVAVDAESHVIVAEDVSNVAADQAQLRPMVAQIKTHTGRQAQELSADAGYLSEANLKELRRRHIRGYVATGQRRHDHPAPETRNKGPYTQAMRARLRRGGRRSRYRLRKQTAEPVIGNIKEPRGFRQFLLRGIEKIRGEWALVCMAHNLLKLARAGG
ncbi:MAG: IS1182 family transposase [Planctomycetota bacterium]|jgi:transposase